MRKTVIYFKSKKALDYLLKNGEVYTIRLRKRSEGLAYVKTHRKGRKIMDVVVRYVGEVMLLQKLGWSVVGEVYIIGKLEDFVNKSGFSSVDEWLEEVKRLNKGKLPDEIFLYHVIEESRKDEIETINEDVIDRRVRELYNKVVFGR